MNKHLTIKRIIDDLMDVMELRRGILRTIYYLSFKPKYVISSYIEDRKGDFSGPIRIFYITFFCWLIWVSGPSRYGNIRKGNIDYHAGRYYGLAWNDDFGYQSSFQELKDRDLKKKIISVSKFCRNVKIDDNPLYTLPFTLFAFSLLTFLLCRNYFRTYIDHLCVNLYLISILLIIRFIFESISMKIFSGLYKHSDYATLGSLIYCIILYTRTFNWENKRLKYFLIPIICWYNPITITWQAEGSFPIILLPLNRLSWFCIYEVYLPILNWFYS